MSNDSSDKFPTFIMDIRSFEEQLVENFIFEIHDKKEFLLFFVAMSKNIKERNPKALKTMNEAQFLGIISKANLSQKVNGSKIPRFTFMETNFKEEPLRFPNWLNKQGFKLDEIFH